MKEVVKPIKRSRIRQVLGKEYFIAKRKWEWRFGKEKYAHSKSKEGYEHVVFTHQSMVLRPLKGVDMLLQENKKTNLEIAIGHLNRIVIKPGEVFSIWKLVGRPTKSKGYLVGLVLNNGKIDRDTGGGLCQLGNLLFWIFAHSPLVVKERYRHGFDVFPDVKRKVPFGAGATLSYNYIDLQVKNETDNTFVLELWLDETHLNGKLSSKYKLEETYEVVEKNHVMRTEFWGGNTRHNQIFQIVTDNKGVKTEKLLVENHAIMMYTPFLSAQKQVKKSNPEKP